MKESIYYEQQQNISAFAGFRINTMATGIGILIMMIIVIATGIGLIDGDG